MNDVPNASLGYCRENEVRILFAPNFRDKGSRRKQQPCSGEVSGLAHSRYKELQLSLRRLSFEVLSNCLLDQETDHLAFFLGQFLKLFYVPLVDTDGFSYFDHKNRIAHKRITNATNI
jgi:hypothetical protein